MAADYDALTTADSDADEEDGTDRESIAKHTPRASHPNRTFYIYTVLHQIHATDDPDAEDIEPDAIGPTYYDLSQANAAAQQVAMGTTLDPHASLSWGIDANGIFIWTHKNLRTNMTTTTWVEREERLLAPTDVQPDSSVNIISRTVWAVKDELSIASSNPLTAESEWHIASSSDIGPLYSSLQAANQAAATSLLENHVFASLPRTQNLNVLDAWKEERRRTVDEKREWFDEKGLPFEEVLELGEGKVVKVWVVEREFVGARN